MRLLAVVGVAASMAATGPAEGGQQDVWLFAGPAVVVRGTLDTGPGLDPSVVIVAQAVPGTDSVRLLMGLCGTDDCSFNEAVVRGTLETAGATSVRLEAHTQALGSITLAGTRGVPRSSLLQDCPADGYTLEGTTPAYEEVRWRGTVNGRAFSFGGCGLNVIAGAVVLRAV